MTGTIHNIDAHSRPSTGSAAEGGGTPALASARGRAAPSQSSEEQPCPETPIGRVSRLQPDEVLAADAPKGNIIPLQPAEGQNFAAACQGTFSPSVASIQHGQCPLQTAQKAVPGRPGRCQGNKLTSLASTTPAAGFAPPGGGTRTKHAATRKARSSMSSQVSSAGKSAEAGGSRTQDPIGAWATASPLAAAVQGDRAVTSSAAMSNDTLGLAADKTQDDAPPTHKRQTTFGSDDAGEHSGPANTGQAAVLQSEGSFTQHIMQQMSYTGCHEDHDHLFLEVRSPPAPACIDIAARPKPFSMASIIPHESDNRVLSRHDLGR